MQFIFSFALFVCSAAYLLYGLATLDLYNSSDQPGPGYFPLIIGILLCITTGVDALKSYKANLQQGHKAVQSTAGAETYAKDTLLVTLFILLFMVTLSWLGSLISMALFTAVLLHYINPGKPLFNVVFSIGLAAGVFVLFDVMLDAGLPSGSLWSA